jgi:hypothetical protein
MALKGTKSRLYFDQWDFSGETNMFVVNLETSEEEATVLTSGAQEFEPILPMMSIEQNGYISTVGVAGTFERELWNRLATNTAIVACALDIDAAGCPVYVQDTTGQQGIQLATPANGLMTIKGVWAKARGGKRGFELYDGTASATGTQTPIDFAVAGTNGGACYLFVQTIGGTATNASVKVQSATTSGGTYTDVATFTFSAVGAIKQTFVGAVNRWLRLNVISMGGATSFRMMAVACVQGVTQ